MVEFYLGCEGLLATRGVQSARWTRLDEIVQMGWKSRPQWIVMLPHCLRLTVCHRSSLIKWPRSMGWTPQSLREMLGHRTQHKKIKPLSRGLLELCPPPSAKSHVVYREGPLLSSSSNRRRTCSRRWNPIPTAKMMRGLLVTFSSSCLRALFV